jgi:hypothetical protein
VQKCVFVKKTQPTNPLRRKKLSHHRMIITPKSLEVL